MWTIAPADGKSDTIGMDFDVDINGGSRIVNNRILTDSGMYIHTYNDSNELTKVTKLEQVQIIEFIFDDQIKGSQYQYEINTKDYSNLDPRNSGQKYDIELFEEDKQLYLKTIYPKGRSTLVPFIELNAQYFTLKRKDKNVRFKKIQALVE